MRYTALGFLLFVCVGCNGLPLFPTKSCEMSAGSSCAPSSDGGACAPACPPPTCVPKCEKPKEEEKKTQARDTAPPVDKTTSRVSVTQDVLLIPRMVYVPYAPQVPVAPARLGMVAPAEKMTTESEMTREPAAAPKDASPPPQDKSAECLDKCAQMLDRLDARLRALEERQRTPMPMPCPSLEPACPRVPCPASEACPPTSSTKPIPTDPVVPSSLTLPSPLPQ